MFLTAMRSQLLWAALLASLITGCSKSPVIPVAGTLSFEGREIPEVCRLSFLPTETAEGASLRPNGATMEPDGRYVLTPHQGVHGLLPGKYKVRVAYYDLKPGGNPELEGDWRERTYDAAPLTVAPGSGPVTYDIVVPKK